VTETEDSATQHVPAASSTPPPATGQGRLASMRRAVLAFAGAGLLAAAGGAYAWSELVPGAPETITLLPSTEVTLTPTAHQQFTAQVKDARGRIVSVTPAWTSLAPVDERGLFTAPDKTGVYFVEAAVGDVKTLAKVTVNAGAARTVRVLPDNATVKPRDMLAFSATAFDEWGNSVPSPVTWRVGAGAGSIDGEGIFVAGTSGASTISAEIDGLVATATATARCVPPRNENAADLIFTVVCGVYADVWLNGQGLDAASITTTIDEAVVAIETAFGRPFGHRLNVNVFSTKENFDRGLRQLFRVEPSPLEEGVFVPPSLIGIDWSAPDIPEAIARHEITHLMVAEIAGRQPVPFWLHEGLATLNEFPVSEETALVSRYCTASAAKIERLPNLSAIVTGAEWRAYVKEVGVVAYYAAAQIASFVVSDAGSQSALLDKMAGGLPVESAYLAASGRSFETFLSDLGGRAQALADRYPGVAVTRRLPDGSSLYVAYGEPANARITIDIRSTRVFGGGTTTTTHYGCMPGSIDSSWPAGSYTVTLNGPAGRATATLQR
jgi:hypothetical protein